VGKVKTNSREYTEAARKIYLEYVFEHPLEYLRNNITKLRVVIKSVLSQFPVNFVMCLLTLTAMTGILLKTRLLLLPLFLIAYIFLIPAILTLVLNVVLAVLLCIRYRRDSQFQWFGLVVLPAVVVSLVFPALTHYFFRASSLTGFFFYFALLCLLLIEKLKSIGLGALKADFQSQPHRTA
jgi:hypothetical protein